MKKFMKALALILALALIMTAFAGCTKENDDNEDDDVEIPNVFDYSQFDGTVYVASYEFEDNHFDVAIILHDDGTYRRIVKKNSEDFTDVEGKYEWEDNELILHNEDKSRIIYERDGDVIVNNSHEFKKVK